MSGGHGEETFLGELGEKVGKKTVGFNIFNLHEFVDWLGEWGVSRALILVILFLGLLSILSLEIPNLPLFAFEWMVGTAPVWTPVVLVIGAFRIWVWYVQSLFLAGRKPVLLEMKVPRDITKSPRAMEVALTNLWLSSGEASFLDRAWKGQVRPFFAFEIASFGGDVHFYIWCWGSMKEFVEQAIYGQYPEVELYEVEDYASKFKYDPDKHWCFPTDWSKLPQGKFGKYGDGKFDRIDCYPLRTYIDYELDKDPKEEHKVDPLSTIIEFMSSIQPQEQAWISLVIRRGGKYGILSTGDRDDDWRKATKDEVDKWRSRGAIVSQQALEAVQHELQTSGAHEGSGRQPQPRPSWMQNQIMQSMERNVSKLPFEFIGHGVYITTGQPRGPYFTSLRWIWKPYGNPTYMSYLRPQRWGNPFDYPWQDFHGYRRNVLMPRRFFDVYRRRAGFHTPWVFPSSILTVEELATLWHPPSATVQAPGLERIPSTKSAAPANLPK
ncbi:MAG: hypothetical protein P4L81_04185 [Candidatus Pacebacteria bacterium]|nr:hypothetical protein [Candidatus Paceibacterota bacterium]